MTTSPQSAGEDFPKQQERVRTVLSHYEAIGPAGVFGATMIRATLRRAELAMASGDIIEILRTYSELKEIHD